MEAVNEYMWHWFPEEPDGYTIDYIETKLMRNLTTEEKETLNLIYDKSREHSS